MAPITLPLSGVDASLNLFNARLTRVSDPLKQIAGAVADQQDDKRRALMQRHPVRLHRRTLMLDTVIVLGAVGGAATFWLVLLFGVALPCTVSAPASLIDDSVLAWRIPRRGAASAAEARRGG